MQENTNNLQNYEGTWRKAEHNAFMKALEKHGRNWQMIQKKVKTRSLTQIRCHANKIFKKIPKYDLDAYIGFESDIHHKKRQSRKKTGEFQEKVRTSPRLQKKDSKQ